MGGCVGGSRWLTLVALVVLVGCGDNAPLTGGTIQHWDGSTWSLSTSTGGPNNRYLRGVWGSGPTDVWAVGLGMVLHHDGSRWTPTLGRNDEWAFTSVWGSGPKDVWVTGSELLHWDGGTWTSVGLPDGVGKVVRGWSGGPNDVWATTSPPLVKGSSAPQPAQPAIIHWDGSAWTIAWRADDLKRDSLGYIWGSGSGEIWAAGIRGSEDHALMLRWNGSTWSEQVLHAADYISQMWGSEAGDVWAVGDEDLLHWDGQAWSSIHPPQEETYAVWGSASDDVWFFGRFGGAHHWNGAAWSRRPGPPAHGSGSAAWGSGPDDVWLVGGVVD